MANKRQVKKNLKKYGKKTKGKHKHNQLPKAESAMRRDLAVLCPVAKQIL